MRNANKHSHEENGKFNHSFKWQKNNDWNDPEDIIHAKKKHQNHRGRSKGQARHNFKEREDLYTQPDEDFAEFEQF